MSATCERDGCDAALTGGRATQRFCSKACRKAAQRRRRRECQPPPATPAYPCPNDCGYVGRTRGETDRHRAKEHRPQLGPVKVTVLAALSFPCPDCDRVYDDDNRLTHHVRVIHEPPAPLPGGDQAAPTDREILVRAGAGRVHGEKYG